MTRRFASALSTFALFQSCWMLVQEPSGCMQSSRLASRTGDQRVSQLRAWICSRLVSSLEIRISHTESMVRSVLRPCPQMLRFDAARGLSAITAETIAVQMQVNSVSNPMDGLEGRSQLLVKLSHSLRMHPEFFGHDGRPGNIVGMDKPCGE